MLRRAVTIALPSFVKPPVTEVAVGARFQPLDRWGLVHLGQFASLLADHGFGREEQRPGFDAPTERFGTPPRAGFEFELVTGAPPVRYWLLNDAGDELLQLQQNWFACNWRKVAPDAKYGRWDSRWEAFERWIREVEDHLNSAPLVFDQAEVTYVNHIEPADTWHDHGDANRVFTFLSEPGGDVRFLPGHEQVAAEMKYVMTVPDRPEEPVGRLSVSLAPAFRPPQTPIFVLTLVARGAPLGDGLDGVRAFAELAHQWIVRGFADLTTPGMHSEWQRDAQDSW
jgi:hypothetical protein